MGQPSSSELNSLAETDVTKVKFVIGGSKGNSDGSGTFGLKVNNVPLAAGNYSGEQQVLDFKVERITNVPSSTPTNNPSESKEPSTVPSEIPSMTPSIIPTENPSVSPSDTPSINPSYVPHNIPSGPPADIPSLIPTQTI